MSDSLSALSAADVHVDLDAEPQLRLAPNVEAVLFRVAQESLRNVLRHADAQHVSVRIQASSDVATLEVEDDGRGMTPPADGAEEHFGLRMLQDLARDSGGSLELDSLPGRGTKVRLEIPLE